MRRIAVVALILFAMFTFPARPSFANGAITDVFASPSAIQFTPTVDHGGMVLTVSGPGNMYLRYELPANRSARVDLQDQAGKPLPDGAYTWELRLSPLLGSTATSDVAEPGRRPGHTLVQTGSFMILNGLPRVAGNREEARADGIATVVPLELGSSAQEGIGATEAAPANGNLIVHDSLCVGADCANGETFNDDTLRLKEETLRVHFEDTTTATGYAGGDWRLLINETTSGGLDRFTVQDSTAGTLPFTITGGADDDSLYVSTGGRVGIGTATPAANLHIVDPNTPSLRLEQDVSGGETAYSWDLAGDDTNFFVRDVTGSNAEPFRIQAGAPSGSLEISADGYIGIGTSSPGMGIHMVDDGIPVGIKFEDSSTGRNWAIKLSGSGIALNKDGKTASFLVFDDGTVRMGDEGAENFLLDTSGNLEIAGTLTQNSDVHSKRDFAPVNGAEVLSKIMALPISTWSFKSDDPEVRHMGPMAQDFHAAFGLGAYDNRLAPVDVDGAALAAIQELNRQLQAKDAQLDAVNARLAQMDALQARLEALEARLAQQP